MDILAFLRFILRRRVLFILLFLFIWLVSIDLLWLLPTKRSIRSSVSELSMQVAENATSNINASLKEILVTAQNASLDIQAEPDRTQKIIERLLERNPLFINVAVVDRNGVELMRAGQFTSQDNVREYSKMSGIYLALAGSASFSDIMSDEITGPASLVTVPIKSPDGIHTILVADVNLEHLAEIVGLPKTGTWVAYITDHQGLEIIGPDVSAIAGKRNFLARPIVQKVAVDGETANGLAADDSYMNEQGIRVFAVGRPIPIANWGLFVERPESEALRQESVVTWLALAIFMLGLFAIIVALWSYWRQAILNEQLSAQGLDLLEKNTQLQELDKAKSEFISIAAHQLRTPLSAIKWTLGLLTDERTDNLTPEQLGLIMKSVESNDRTIKLINEMLVATRIEAGKIHLTIGPIRIEDLIESVVLDFVSQAYARKIKLVFDPPKRQLPFISADPDQIRNVIQNLIENAIRYTTEGGSVHLSVDVENDTVKVSVIDTGIGIPAKQQSSIFNKFFRAENATRKQADGTGLGLFIAKGIVEKHGGHLYFTSVEGKGTTFCFTLPVFKGTTPE